ncbi:MAG TPA: MinD/ParA family protein [Syntrophorhabdales bacterium]|nr:MinD/ParA family protein [Syntrophorhabdales bacterium]
MDEQIPIIASVASGKGGVGKTFVTVNLAALLAKKKKRVLAVDCDLGLANMDIMLGLDPPLTLKDVVFGGATIRDAIIPTKAGFDLIAGSSGVKEMAQPLYEKIQLIKDALRPIFPSYDYVLLDTGAGISEMVLQFNLLAYRNIIVLNRELTSLTDAYAMIKVMYQIFARDCFSVIVNSTATEKEGRKIFSQIDTTCRKFLGFPLEYLGSITSDQAVPRSIIRQEVLAISTPQSLASKDCDCITQGVCSWETSY